MLMPDYRRTISRLVKGALNALVERGDFNPSNPLDALALVYGYDWPEHVQPKFAARCLERTAELWDASDGEDPESRISLVWNFAEFADLDEIKDLVSIDERSSAAIAAVEERCRKLNEAEEGVEREDDGTTILQQANIDVARALNRTPGYLGVPVSDSFRAAAMIQWVDDPIEDLERSLSSADMKALFARAVQPG